MTWNLDEHLSPTFGREPQGDVAAAPTAPRVAPGRSTLTSRLPPSPASIARAMIAQLRTSSGGAAGEGDDDAVRAHAARGTAGGSGPLPFLDEIQRAFGHHDVAGIDAHRGGHADAACEAMGANAYATGHHVVLGRGQDLHTVAHEAAHVVQQRRGVHLSTGVGRADDVYELHADAVADRVVRGESAEALLDEMAGGSGGGSSAIQLDRNAARQRGLELRRRYERGALRRRGTAELVADARELAGEMSGGEEEVRGYVAWSLVNIREELQRRIDAAPLDADGLPVLEGLPIERGSPNAAILDDIDPFGAFDVWVGLVRQPPRAEEASTVDPRPQPTGDPPPPPPPQREEPTLREGQSRVIELPEETIEGRVPQPPARHEGGGDAEGLSIETQGTAELLLFQSPEVEIGRYVKGRLEARGQIVGGMGRSNVGGGGDGNVDGGGGGGDRVRVTGTGRPALTQRQQRRIGGTVEFQEPALQQVSEWCGMDLSERIEVSHESLDPRGRGGLQVGLSIQSETAHLGPLEFQSRLTLIRNARGRWAPEILPVTAIATVPIESDGVTVRLRIEITFVPQWTAIIPELSRLVREPIEHAGRLFRGGSEAASEVGARGAGELASEGGVRGAGELGGDAAARGGGELASEGAMRGGGEAAGELGARTAAEVGTELAPAGMRGALGTAGHIAGEAVLPLMVLYDFYRCMEYISGIEDEIMKEAMKSMKVNDFADVLSAWIFGTESHHQARVAEIERQAPWRAAASNSGTEYIQRSRRALREARMEAQRAWRVVERQPGQAEALRREYGTQEALFEALGREVAERQGVEFHPDEFM
jgi:hypothetical protein